MERKLYQPPLLVVLAAAGLAIFHWTNNPALLVIHGVIAFVCMVYLAADMASVVVTAQKEHQWKVTWIACMVVFQWLAVIYFYFWAYPRMRREYLRSTSTALLDQDHA